MSDLAMSKKALTDTPVQILLQDSNRQTAARKLLRQTLDAKPTTLAYMGCKAKLPPPPATQKIAFLSSYTIETIAPFLEVESFLAEWRAEATFLQYSNWLNALHNPASLDASNAVVLLLHGEALLPWNSTSADDAIALLDAAIQSFRNQSSLPLFLGLIAEPPECQAIGLGRRPRHGRAAMIEQINTFLSEQAAQITNVHCLDLPEWARIHGDSWYDRTGYLANMTVVSHKALPALARGIARSVGCLFKPRRKVLAIDLDNSLWGGIVGEDGAEGVVLSPDKWPGAGFVAFQRVLAQLRDSGILLVINSKNNEADAQAVFETRPEMALAWNDFTARRINWQDKASNLEELSEELGLGLDSFVFADDSPVECALVEDALPMIDVVELGKNPAEFIDRLFASGSFDTLAISREDKARAASYHSENLRKNVQARSRDLGDFLAGLDLHLEIRPIVAASADRAHQLLSKTNQFNLSLTRPTPDDVQKLMQSGEHLYGATLKDRFGEYGIIAVMELRATGDRLDIASLVISCRALGRQVEEAIIQFATTQVKQRACKLLCAGFRQGPRNQQVVAFLERTGFRKQSDTDELTSYILNPEDLQAPQLCHITVDAPEMESIPS